MINRSIIIRPFVTVLFIGMFLVTSVITVDDSFARQGDKRPGKSIDSKGRGDRSFDRQRNRKNIKYGHAARRRGRRIIISPRVSRYGYVVPRLPRGYRRIWHSRKPFYYYRGVFYRPGPAGFIVVGPPLGAIVVTLPIGYRRIWVDDLIYYTYGGVIYRRVPSGYAVVEAPPAVVIEEEAPAIVQPYEPATGKVSVTASILNVRSGPSITYPVIYQIHKGYILEIHGKTTGWIYVQLPNGEFGWVMNVYTDVLELPGSG